MTLEFKALPPLFLHEKDTHIKFLYVRTWVRGQTGRRQEGPEAGGQEGPGREDTAGPKNKGQGALINVPVLSDVNKLQ